MAIKIAGTEVISDSRGLNNIASVDATTVAALGTAGVGGGGGSFDMTATGSITAGKVVALNSNGTVSTVVNQAGDPATPLSQATNSAIKQLNLFPSHGVDNARQRVLVAYIDQNNSNHGTAVCGQIESNGSITWGTPLVWYSSAQVDCNMSVVYHENNNTYYIFHKNPSTGEPAVARIANTLGTTISLQNYYTNPGNHGGCSSEGYAGVYDPDQQRVVFVWYSTGASDGIVGTFDTSFSASTIFTSNDWSPYADMTYDTTNNKCVHLRQYNNISDARALVITVGASSVSVGSEVSTGAQGGEMPRCTFDPDSGKVILVGAYPGQATKTYYGMGTVSGTSSSWTNGVVNSTGMSDGSTAPYDITYDTGADKLVMSYRKDSNSAAVYMRIGTISGSSLTFGSEVETYSGGGVNYVRLDYLPSTGMSVMTGSKSDSTRLLASAVTTVVASTNPNWFGIADESISSGSAGKITHIGGINESVSGLTAGTTYYADKVGGLSATDTGYKVGRAISATKLLITEGNA